MSRSDGYEYFFPFNFFSEVKFFLKFYSTKRRSKREKLCEKDYRSPTSLKEKTVNSHSSQVGHLARAFAGESFSILR